MKIGCWKKKAVSFFVAAVLLVTSLSAGLFSLVGKKPVAAEMVTPIGTVEGYIAGYTDKDAISYEVGETITFTFELRATEGEKNQLYSCPKFKYKLESDDGTRVGDTTVDASNGTFTVQTSLSEPGFTMVTVWACDASGTKLANVDSFFGGAGAGVSQIQPAVEEPNDFDEFWTKQIALLNDIQPVEISKTEVSTTNPNFNVYNVKIKCVEDAWTGNDYVSGYLTVPKDATAGSLKIMMAFRGYSVDSAYIQYNSGAATFSVTPHAIETGETGDYYAGYSNGVLKDFGLKADANQTAENVYFRNMILRNLQALRYMKTLTEWNGEDVCLSAGSMGAFQATSLAALDNSVTKLTLDKPWMCDLGGYEKGDRLGSTFFPAYTEALKYYDTTSFGKRLECSVNIVTGLGDTISRPVGVAALYNAIPENVNKTISFMQNKTHDDAFPDEVIEYTSTNVEASAPVTYKVEEDACARGRMDLGGPAATAEQLYVTSVQRGGNNWAYDFSYLQFDYSGFEGVVKSAVIQLTLKDVTGQFRGGRRTVSVYCSGTDFDESTLTFGNRPSIGDSGAELVATLLVGKTKEEVYQFDIASYLNKHAATLNGKVTVILGNLTNDTAGKALVGFYSKEANADKAATLTVSGQPTKISALSMATEELTLYQGQTYGISLEKAPFYADDEKISFCSSEPTVADVDDDGMVKGMGVGSAIITATAENGATAELTVNVVQSVSSYDQTFIATDDTYTQYWNQTTVGGKQDKMVIQRSMNSINETQNDRNALLKFDFSAYGGGYVDSAKIRLYVYAVNTGFTEDRTLSVSVIDPNWSEDTLTYDNDEGHSNPVIKIVIPASVKVGDCVEIDVTDYVSEHFSELGGQLSIKLENLDNSTYRYTNADKNGIEFYSKDSTATQYAPSLQISTAFPKETEEVLSSVYGTSLSLTGNIGLNFYMQLADKVLADEGANVVATVGNAVTTLPVKDAEVKTSQGEEYYVFTVEVAAKDMETEAKVQVVLSDGSKGTEYTYSVKAYADEILASEKAEYVAAQPLVKAMLEYGKQAKAFFAGESVEATAEMNEVTAETLANYAASSTGTLAEGVQIVGTTLELKGETAIRVYFTATDIQSLTCKVAGEVVTPTAVETESGLTVYVLTLSDISAKDLDTAYVFSIGEFEITYSALSYAQAVLSANSNVALINVVKALYLYNEAANAYLA